ncbi:YwmB family TATA-box binding protein [Clostridium massiliodielmoense]|uniref:YwmB family TATA-box binding protein n=1 Tax=Clostridium massiliodielmoense TaxID=1776385 RepID=UPI0001668957|nr:YwmB family TATA-box binding protein [Clostridium massiliodielmoense]EDS78280.1 conserved hypothetical protein [Clostridium botulinum C str. Eklund]KEH97621.1 hypothetical protein Z962_02560 [Clostridium botulinum C/D str. BKT12695]NEZ49858.1 hypothetical protein [Clostridium botulinum]
MNNNVKNGVLFFIITISIFLNCKVSYAYKNINFFDEIIRTTRSNVEEYGVETHFKTKINGQDLISYFNNMIGDKEYYKLINYKNENSCYIKFNDYNNAEGIISIENLKSNPLVKVSIVEKGNYNNLKQLNKWVKNIECKISEEGNIHYQYLKAKLPKGSLNKVNKELIELLKGKGAKNIDSIEINNGFTTCAYTRQYKSKRINGKLMDFNYALSNYSSGSYVTIGTPEIITTY